MDIVNEQREIEDGCAPNQKDQPLTEKWNIHVSKCPTLNVPESLTVTGDQLSERTVVVRNILEKITFDIPEITALYQDKQLLHNLISSVRSMKTTLNWMKQHNTNLSILHSDVILSTAKFLTKVNLLLLSIFRTDSIPDTVYLDLFMSFLEICGILTWPGDIYQRKSLVLGEVQSGSPDLYLLSQNVDDNLMNTVGTVTYSRQEIIIQGDVPDDFGICEHSNIQEGMSQFTKRTENNTILPTQLSHDTHTTLHSKHDINVTSELMSTPRHNDVMRTPNTPENVERATDLPCSQPRPAFLARKRTFEGRIKQPAVKLSPENGIINKIPIIITLAPDSENPEEDIKTGESQSPSGPRKCTFQTPGRKLNIPTRLFAGVKSAMEHEFPSTKLQTTMHNLSSVPLPIIVTTAEATEAKLKCLQQTETGDENRSCKSYDNRVNSNSVTCTDLKHSSDVEQSVMTSDKTKILTNEINDIEEKEKPLPPATDFPIPGTSGIKQGCLIIASHQEQSESLSACQIDTDSNKTSGRDASSRLHIEKSEIPAKCESVRNSASNNHNTSSKPACIVTSCQCNRCAKQIETLRKIPSKEHQLSHMTEFCNGMGLERVQVNLKELSSKKNRFSTNKPQIQMQLNFGNIELENPTFQVKNSLRSKSGGISLVDMCKHKRHVCKDGEYIKGKHQTSKYPNKYPKRKTSKALYWTVGLRKKRHRQNHERKSKTNRKQKEFNSQIKSYSGLGDRSCINPDMLTFHGKLGPVSPSEHHFPQSFIEDDDGHCINNATIPVFTVNSQNSMYAVKINSEFQCSNYDGKPNTSILINTKCENRYACYNDQHGYVQPIIKENVDGNCNTPPQDHIKPIIQENGIYGNRNIFGDVQSTIQENVDGTFNTCDDQQDYMQSIIQENVGGNCNEQLEYVPSIIQENVHENYNSYKNQHVYVPSIHGYSDENQNTFNNGQREYVQLRSIDWLLGQPLECPDTSDIHITNLEDTPELIDPEVLCPDTPDIGLIDQDLLCPDTPDIHLIDPDVLCADTPDIQLSNLDIFENSVTRQELSNSNKLGETYSTDFSNKNFNALENFGSILSDDFIRNLVLEWPHSKTKPISIGLMLHKTKVIIVSLEMSHHYYEYLIGNGNNIPEDAPIIRYSRVLDLLKQVDRQVLACITSQLCHM